MRARPPSSDDLPWSDADLALLRELVPLLRELNAHPTPQRARELGPLVSAVALDLHRSAAAIDAKAAELGLG
ncbi:MAG TPA: hypothetical protein VKA00_03325 [Trueperaceae bacterium]|nr:hypothetical protein [Trueperaceae bacterium]